MIFIASIKKKNTKQQNAFAYKTDTMVLGYSPSPSKLHAMAVIKRKKKANNNLRDRLKKLTFIVDIFTWFGWLSNFTV